MNPQTGEMTGAAGSRLATEKAKSTAARNRRAGPSKRERDALADVAARMGVVVPPAPSGLRLVHDTADGGGGVE